MLSGIFQYSITYLPSQNIGDEREREIETSTGDIVFNMHIYTHTFKDLCLSRLYTTAGVYIF